jgi:hypothetical protein
VFKELVEFNEDLRAAEAAAGAEAAAAGGAGELGEGAAGGGDNTADGEAPA